MKKHYYELLTEAQINALIATEGMPFYAADMGISGAVINNLKHSGMIEWTGNTHTEQVTINADNIITVSAKEWVVTSKFMRFECSCSEFVVYTEEFTDNGFDRWYYGIYTKERANAVALRLGDAYPIYHCVCKATEARDYNIKNLPDNFRY